MSVLEGKTLGKEQLILLPVEQQAFTLTTDPSVQVVMHTGRQAIVVSGYAGIFRANSSEPGFFVSPYVDDDDVVHHEVHFLVGPFWIDLVQVSASVSPGGIASLDSDEVDHSRWVVAECTWEVATFPEGEKIRLKVKIQTQGAANGWLNLAYQVVATGTLTRMPTPDEISADLS
jgi:hypothetical protein